MNIKSVFRGLCASDRVNLPKQRGVYLSRRGGWVMPVIAIGWFCTACSNQQVYQVVQENQVSECQELPPSQIEQCLARHEQTYDDYVRDRQTVLEE